MLCRFNKLFAAAMMVISMTSASAEDLSWLNRPVWFKVDDLLFRIPQGYTSAWNPPNQREDANDVNSISFVFWMPEQRYLEIDPVSAIDPRPQEKGRPKPSQNSFVVRVSVLRPTALDNPAFVSPARQFENVTAPSNPTRYTTDLQAFGLRRLLVQSSPYPKAFDYFASPEASDPQVLLKCIPDDDVRTPYKGCTGDVYSLSTGFAFRILFPRESLPLCKSVIGASLQLASSWIVKG